MPVWFIATVWPAIVKFPLRLCEPPLALTDQGAVLPETEIDAQPTFEVADVGGQSLGIGVIVIDPAAPPAPALMLFVLKPYEQAAPDCVTVTVCPATVMFPFRGDELGLAPTIQLTELPATLSVVQATFEVAVGGLQPTGAVALIDPEPPPAATLRAVGLTVYGQVPVDSFKTKPS
jgi:hypothetical protein